MLGRTLSPRLLLTLASAAVAFTPGCTPSLAEQAAQSPRPFEPTPLDAAAAAPAPPPAPEPPPDPNAWDPASIPMVLDDPRLATVKAEVDRESYARAAQALQTALASTPPSPAERPVWLYQLGRLRALGGDPLGAAQAFDESAATPWALSDYARLQAAQWLVGAGKPEGAIERARLVPQDLPIAPAAELVIADALLAKNDMPAAAVRYRAYLAREKHPPNWVNVALRFSSALLHHPSEANNEEAVRLARRVLFESPGGQAAGTAKDLEKKGLEVLPEKKRKAFEKLTADEQLAKAHQLEASHQYREAVLVTDKLIKLPRAKKPGDFACEVWMVRGDALAKMGKKKRNESADAFKGTLEHCDGQSKLAEAMFDAGRASATAGRQVEAMERFERLEKEFPQHRLADDARFRGAKAALDAGDEAKFASMMGRIADDYPTGDKGEDGLFELALFHMNKGEWAKAIPPLEKALARAPHEHGDLAAGRLPYFLARARLATGQIQQGMEGLAATIRDYPLSYYMALAYSRLADKDRAAADRAIAEASAKEQQGRFTLPRGAWSEAPGFLRAVELVRQGDFKLMKGELDKLGVGSHKASRETVYAAAFLQARAGAVTPSHRLLRQGLTGNQPREDEPVDWAEHYPVGRWRAAWEVAFPRPFLPLVTAAAAKEGLPEAWAYGIMREESAFEPRATSAAAAYGLMQLIVPTAQRMAKTLDITADEETLKKPEVNIPIGVHFLQVLRRDFPDNPLLAIPGYNAGPGAPKKWVDERPTWDFDLWVERIPYEETRKYTKRVMTSMAAYEFLYARDKPSEALRSPLGVSKQGRGAVAAAP